MIEEIESADPNRLADIASQLIEEDKYDEALECCNHALELNPTDIVIFNYKAYVLNLLDRYDEALECCERAFEVSPRHKPMFEHKAYALSMLDRHAESLECCNRALEFMQNQPRARPEHDRSRHIAISTSTPIPPRAGRITRAAPVTRIRGA